MTSRGLRKVRWEVSSTDDEEPVGVAYGIRVEGEEEEIVARGAVSKEAADSIVRIWNWRLASPLA